MTTKQRGGSRQGAGAPRLAPGQTTESVQVRLDPARKAKALAIGGGSVAKGVRAAIDAYPAAKILQDEIANGEQSLESFLRDDAEKAAKEFWPRWEQD